jgi:hypothetical protein
LQAQGVLEASDDDGFVVLSFIGCKTPEALRTTAIPPHNGTQEKRLSHPIEAELSTSVCGTYFPFEIKQARISGPVSF